MVLVAPPIGVPPSGACSTNWCATLVHVPPMECVGGKRRVMKCATMYHHPTPTGRRDLAICAPCAIPSVCVCLVASDAAHGAAEPQSGHPPR